MYEGVYFQLRLKLPSPDSFDAWTRQVLLDQRPRLAPVPGFGALDLGDEDLLSPVAGGLPVTATVGDLIAHLRTASDRDRLLVEFLTWDGDQASALVHGFMLDWDCYREYRLPLIYAGAAAGPLGGRGHVSMIGEAGDDEEDDYEDVVVFTDVTGDRIDIAQPDPDELLADDLADRFGEIGADDAYDRMLSRP